MNSFEKLLRDVNKPWGSQPSNSRMGFEVLILAIFISGCIFWFRSLSPARTRDFFLSLGVKIQKMHRASLEIERKTFHLTGLLVPLSYHICTAYWWNQADFITFSWRCTAFIWLCDLFRVMVPSSMHYLPFSLLRRIIREKEMGQLSGTCYFSLGCTLSMQLYPPAVAVTSIVWLVVGDMSAALIGVAFGGETCVVKMGREGKKSLEGSVAMFFACMICGLIGWWNVRFSDYAVLVGSICATLVELWEPLGLNDNITIPIFSGAALQWALARVENC